MQLLFMALMKVRGSASFSFACVEFFMTRLYLSSFGEREKAHLDMCLIVCVFNRLGPALFANIDSLMFNP